ncbi:MAG: ATP-binding protein [Methanobacterium sp.]
MDKNIETIKILLFEDNPGDAGLIEAMLEEFNDFSYKLKNVESLDEGLNFLKKHSFDVILLDLGLPDSDGINTFLDVHKISPGIPIIILTGLNDEKTGINAVKKGAQDYLVKGNVSSELLERSIKYSIERKKTEEAIRVQAEMLSQVNDAIIAIDNDYNVTYWNKGAERLYDFKSDEILGKPLSYSHRYEWITPDGEKEAYNLLETQGYWRGENVHIKKNGEKIYVDVLTTIIKDNKGNPKGMLATIRDITERKEAINELERSNKELQSFAYITSHDLQEPLRSIASYAQLLQRRYEGKLDSDADDFIDFMVAGATRMKDQIQGLLDYSRVGTHGEEFNKFNAGDALNIALSNLKSSIDEYDADVNPDPLPDIVADESQITRVFQNLISNALKFRREGIQPKIHVSAQNKDDEYIFSVQDNGIGIEEQYNDRIFEVFKRLHAIGEYEGAGIGLAIVKRIIERHGGRLWVESEFGVGSTFYFSIPAKDVK